MVARLGLFGLNGGSAAIGGSVCAHGIALAVGLRLASASVPAGAPSEQLVEVDVVTPIAAAVLPAPVDAPVEKPAKRELPPPPPAAPLAGATRPSVTREAAARGPIADEAPAPSQAPIEAAPALTVDSTLPSFTLSVGGSVREAHGAVSTKGGPDAVASDAPLSEHAVSTPARLARGGAPPYPSAARADGVEGDVVLELILSATGGVESARITKGVGHGLDEAALTAVRGYRFSPATKDGRAVRVRMRWTVQFRLD